MSENQRFYGVFRDVERSVVEDQKILISRGVVLWVFREFLGGMKNQYDHSIKNNYSDML